MIYNQQTLTTIIDLIVIPKEFTEKFESIIAKEIEEIFRIAKERLYKLKKLGIILGVGSLLLVISVLVLKF